MRRIRKQGNPGRDVARRSLAAAPLLALAALACGGDREPTGAAAEAAQAAFLESSAAAVRAAIESPPDPADDRAAAIWAEVTEIYTSRDHRPLWFDHRGPTPQGRELAIRLVDIARHGLDPADHGGERLALRLAELTDRDRRGDREGYARRVGRLDPSLTHGFLLLAEHLGRGQIRPSEAGIHWESEPRDIDLAKVAAAAHEEGATTTLAAVRPAHPQYEQLERALERYRSIVKRGGWPAVPPGDTLEPGNEDPRRVVPLRHRLALEGHATGEGDDDEASDRLSPRYDEALAEAVRAYQRRRGLTPDGLVGGKTLDELNVSAVDRVRQIEANLERWRWMPANLGDRYVLVNVPRFELHVVENGDEVMRMRVVVGEELNATPMFSDEMEYVVFNPYWNVPASIAGEEIVPAFQRDPGYLVRNEMEVVRGWEDAEVLGAHVPPSVAAQAADESSGLRIRQRPGAQNPLGRIKFMFPNEHAIYLHDTSAAHLFDETVRLFSHGCIRVEKPVELAAWALGQPRSAVRAEMASGAGDEWRSLPQHIPVHILYFTVAVDDDGSVLFFDDHYGLDERVLAALDDRPAAALPLLDDAG
ncbi:MAG TPA: L,D-transpeptidase family protein [Thermoanaerobaculia bacterium]|nr:L,D-transpeptidase family protein [Thermoanaerobaculia bacterium]